MLIEKIKKGLDSTYYLLGVVIAMIIFWAIPYTLLEINILKYQETVKLFENIALILIGVFILLTLSFYENIFYIVPIIVFKFINRRSKLVNTISNTIISFKSFKSTIVYCC